jgi:uncharacterized membrane protein
MSINLEPSRNLGSIGALLLAIGTFFPFLSVVGIILVLVSLKGLSEYYKEEKIYRNALYGVVFGIVGIAVSVFLFLAVVFSVLGFIRPMSLTPAEHPLRLIIGFVLSIILILLVLVVFLTLEGLFLKKSFDILSSKSGERLFGTAGILLLVGAVLTIILVGLVLVVAGWIIAAVAFFSLKSKSEYSQTQPTPQAT